MPYRLDKRLLQISLIPAMVFCAGLLLFFTFLMHSRASSAFVEQTRADAEMLAVAMVLPVRNGATDALDPVLRQALTLPNARGIRVFDTEGNVLASRGRVMDPTQGSSVPATAVTERVGNWQRITVPLRLPEWSTSGQPAAGWLQIDFSRNNLTLELYRQATIAGVMGLIGLAIVWVVVLLAGRRVTEPVRELQETMSRLADGDLDARFVARQGAWEGIGDQLNHLGESLQQAHQEMQSSIDQATQDLRETLETLEIQNIELSTARRQAVEAGEAKSQFLANMSHEIRTPLNGILGFIDLLDTTHLSAKQRDYVRTIQRSAESLLAIINDVLDVMKLDAGKLTLEHRSLNILDLVEDVLDMLAPTAQEKDLELVAMVYDDVPRLLLGDPLRVRQVLINLVSNAIKFTDRGHVAVRVALEDEDHRIARLRIAVEDTGRGIAAEKQAHLFQAFSQADASTTRKFGGSGLGLLICQRLVKRMGGRIELESTIGAGSTFSVLVDLELDTQTPLEPDTDDQIPPDTHILLCEPHPITGLVLYHRFKSWGCPVARISPDDTPALPEGWPPSARSLAVVTFQPGRTDWLHQLIDACLYAGIPVLLLARLHEGGPELRALESSVAVLATKPLRNRKLISACQKALDSGQAGDSARKPPELPDAAPPKVLLVDDNAVNRRLVRTFLENMQIQPVEASDGSEALEAVSRTRFDLVLMDLQMPTMDGTTATREIRRHEADGERLPIVALTAQVMSDEREPLRDSGFSDVLTKPVSERQLAALLERWTGERRKQAVSALSRQSESGPVDPGLAVARAGGQVDLAADMLDGLVQEIQTAQAEWPGLGPRELAPRVHALLGVTRYCGTPCLEDRLRQMERALRAAPAEPPEAEFAAVLESMDAVERWCRDHDPVRELATGSGNRSD